MLAFAALMSLKSFSLKYLVDVLRFEGSIAPMYCFFSSSSCSNQIDFVLLDKIANEINRITYHGGELIQSHCKS